MPRGSDATVGEQHMITIDQIVDLIRSKKELSTLDHAFVKERVERILSGDARITRKMEASRDVEQFTRSKEYEGLLKMVRKELRVVYGVFQKGPREELIRELREAPPGDKQAVIERILATHTSTAERLPYYDEFWKGVTSRIPAPKTVLDLGCGLNPLSYGWMVRHKWRPFIIASDIGDMGFLKEAASALGIPVAVEQRDLVTHHDELPLAEVTLMLKLLDSLEEAHRHISYEIFDRIKSPWIVVSFPTQSLGGKKRIAAAGRAWFDRLLERKGVFSTTFSLPNELVYVIGR